MHEALEVLDNVKLNFSGGGILFINITLALIMFGIALEINFRHFQEVIKRPISVLVGLVSQFLLLPALTFLFAIVLKPTPTVALGMILVASCPGGNISNFISSLAKGNTALSISLTAISTLLAILMTPFNFALWGGLFIRYYNQVGAENLLQPIAIDQFQMFQTVFLLLGIPVILGLFTAKRFPHVTHKIKKPLKSFSVVFFIVLVIGMLASNYKFFVNYIHLVFLIVLVHNALALTTGFFAAWLTNLPRIDRRSITIETGIQNSGLALALLFNPKVFPVEMELGGMTIIAAWWGIWHIISGLTIAYFWSRKKLN